MKIDKIFSLIDLNSEKLAEQHENHQKTTRILEQNLRISTHELEISKKD